jgi:hypothetical protein
MGRLAVAGDLVAVNAGCRGSRQLADVIWRDGDSGQPAAWLAGVLDRYPGCAVAAIRVTDGGCLVATRAGYPLFFHNERRLNTLVCATFVHGWLAAGWPLAAFDPPRLETVAEPFACTTATIPFAMYYEDEPAPSSASRRRI